MFSLEIPLSKEASHRFVARPAINADDKVIKRVTRAPAFLFLPPDDWTNLMLRAHGETHLRLHATWQEVSLIVAVDHPRL